MKKLLFALFLAVGVLASLPSSASAQGICQWDGVDSSSTIFVLNGMNGNCNTPTWRFECDFYLRCDSSAGQGCANSNIATYWEFDLITIGTPCTYTDKFDTGPNCSTPNHVVGANCSFTSAIMWDCAKPVCSGGCPAGTYRVTVDIYKADCATLIGTVVKYFFYDNTTFTWSSASNPC